MPQGSETERRERDLAMQEGLKVAVEVPLRTARLSLEALKVAEVVARHGNPNSITDVGVGAQIAFTGVKGGLFNVLTNLKDITDADFAERMRQQCDELESQAGRGLEIMDQLTKEKIGS